MIRRDFCGDTKSETLRFATGMPTAVFVMVFPKRHQQRTTAIVRGKMRRRLCPQCGSLAGQFLTEASREADVDYYECEHCGETWIVDPMNPTRPQRGMKPPKSRSISLR